jgi:hypothetical protein
MVMCRIALTVPGGAFVRNRNLSHHFGKKLRKGSFFSNAAAELRLSPQRADLYNRTLAIRQAIGRVSGDLTKMVRDMREQGD